MVCVRLPARQPERLEEFTLHQFLVCGATGRRGDLAGGPLTAEGSFHGTTQSGERIYTRIPVFALTPPSDPS